MENTREKVYTEPRRCRDCGEGKPLSEYSSYKIKNVVYLTRLCNSCANNYSRRRGTAFRKITKSIREEQSV